MGNAYDLYTQYLFEKAGTDGIPLSGTFELTSRCNLDCRMCYIHSRANDSAAIHREKTAGEWLSLGEECAKAGMLLLLLTGGEPLLRQDFREIYTGCRRLGLMVSLNTNGTLMTQAMQDFLAKDPPVRVNLTLYGMSPDTYGRLTGDPNGFTRAVDAIHGLKERGVPLKLNYSITPYNVGDAANAFAFAAAEKLPLQAASYMFPPVRASKGALCTAARLTPEEAAQARLLYDRCRFSDEELRERWTRQLAGNPVAEPNRECQELPRESIRCRAGSSSFWVTWDGKLRPCGLMTNPGVTLSLGSFAQSWRELREKTKQIMIPPQCSGCSARAVCDACPAVCQGETGSFTEVPRYMCEMTAAYLEQIQRALHEIESRE